MANGVSSNVARFTLAELIALAGRQDRDNATGSIGAWPVVRRGHRDHPVRTLQHLLRARGQAVRVDGVFGPETEAAVRAFQTGKGLSVDGIVGPRTWAALIVTVRQGSSGDAVRGVQEEFQFRNLSGDPSRGLQVDGIFGPRTEEAVRGFQQALSLDVPSVAVDGSSVPSLGGPRQRHAVLLASDLALNIRTRPDNAGTLIRGAERKLSSSPYGEGQGAPCAAPVR